MVITELTSGQETMYPLDPGADAGFLDRGFKSI